MIIQFQLPAMHALLRTEKTISYLKSNPMWRDDLGE